MLIKYSWLVDFIYLFIRPRGDTCGLFRTIAPPLGALRPLHPTNMISSKISSISVLPIVCGQDSLLSSTRAMRPSSIRSRSIMDSPSVRIILSCVPAGTVIFPITFPSSSASSQLSYVFAVRNLSPRISNQSSVASGIPSEPIR